MSLPDANDVPLNQEEVETLGLDDKWEDVAATSLQLRDATTGLPRKRLPPKLGEGAPNRKLEDAARLLEENPSMGTADREYVLQYYADALAGKAAAFDLSGEKAAIVDPQPQWTQPYDPAVVALQDTAADALQGKGLFSVAKGYQFTSTRIPPSAVGVVDVNPTRAPLSAGEEVSAIMAEYDRVTAADEAEATAAITSSVERSLGLVPGRMAKQQAASAASSPPPRGGRGATFFERYAGGERAPELQPPAGGHRRTDVSVGAAPVPSEGKAKKKKK